ncbi:MAG TPA: hypothetical protein ENJ08_04450 [Gammaproteobacteria bacterium]|nr:hypothetical protein [Gammaproteobacteria bacterium]
MTNEQCIKLPIFLADEQVSDLMVVDELSMLSSSKCQLQTLSNLNTQIISQLVALSEEHAQGELLPLCITVSALVPLA